MKTFRVIVSLLLLPTVLYTIVLVQASSSLDDIRVASYLVYGFAAAGNLFLTVAGGLDRIWKGAAAIVSLGMIAWASVLDGSNITYDEVSPFWSATSLLLSGIAWKVLKGEFSEPAEVDNVGSVSRSKPPRRSVTEQTGEAKVFSFDDIEINVVEPSGELAIDEPVVDAVDDVHPNPTKSS